MGVRRSCGGQGVVVTVVKGEGVLMVSVSMGRET